MDEKAPAMGCEKRGVWLEDSCRTDFYGFSRAKHFVMQDDCSLQHQQPLLATVVHPRISMQLGIQIGDEQEHGARCRCKFLGRNPQTRSCLDFLLQAPVQRFRAGQTRSGRVTTPASANARTGGTPRDAAALTRTLRIRHSGLLAPPLGQL